MTAKLQDPYAMDVCAVDFSVVGIARYQNAASATKAARKILGHGVRPIRVSNRFQSVWVVAQSMADKTWRFYGAPDSYTYWTARFDWSEWRVTGVDPECRHREKVILP